MKRGYFGIGVWFPTKSCNMGTLFRSAFAFEADFIFTIGRSYARQSSDTCNAARHLPCYNYSSLDEFQQCRPKGAQLVCIEITEAARDLRSFIHPERAIYLLGSEGGGLPQELLEKNLVVKIPTVCCLNLASCGTVVLYDRVAKCK